MSKALVIADSGFFVGLFTKQDQHHAECVRFYREFKGTLLTCWAVFTEVSYLLNPQNLAAFFSWAEKAQAAGHLMIDNPHPDAVGDVWQWMNRYADLPMDFCDASLVLLAIDHKVSEIASTDARDFMVYRLPNRKRFKQVLYSLS